LHNFRSILAIIRAGIVATFYAGTAGAQILKDPPPKFQSTQIWHANDLYTIAKGAQLITREGKEIPIAQIKGPTESSRLTTWKGICWAFNSVIKFPEEITDKEKRGGGSPLQPSVDLSLLNSTDFSTWNLVGKVGYANGFPRALYPLGKDDLFFADNLDGSFVEKEKGSYFAIFHQDKEDKIDFQELVDLEINGESIFELKKNISRSKCYNIISFSKI
jgi:hypothetical protein